MNEKNHYYVNYLLILLNILLKLIDLTLTYIGLSYGAIEFNQNVDVYNSEFILLLFVIFTLLLIGSNLVCYYCELNLEIVTVVLILIALFSIVIICLNIESLMVIM